MSSEGEAESGPDLTQGVTIADFGGGELLRGHVGKEAVVLAHVGDEFFAVGASCTHYGGPLDQGIIVGDTVRCPLHHARFSLRTGEAVGAPAFDPLPRWQVKRDGDRITVGEQEPAAQLPKLTADPAIRDVVIIGGGAAGFACAEMLRRRGYTGKLVMLSDDKDPPVDRPNLSKGYLAGEAPEEWIPLRGADYYPQAGIELKLDTHVSGIDVKAQQVTTSDGAHYHYDRLLLATGAEPVRPPIPGADKPHVFTLRTLADSRLIAAAAKQAKSALILGSGFIGLEAAAALRQVGVDVHVVSLDEQPLARVMGKEVGAFIRKLHEDHGVHFHLGQSLASIGDKSVTLKDGSEIAADLVILGVGVAPRIDLARAAGLATDRGVQVDAHLQTSIPGIYAAGDIASWPADDGGRQRVEHWVVAERQGQTVAENILGAGERYRDAPFFWSMHYDVAIRYVGHAHGWDSIDIDGDLASRNCLVRYRKGDKTLAVAAIGRDAAALQCGCQLEAA